MKSRFPFACRLLLLLCLPFSLFGQKTTVSTAKIQETYAFYQNTDPTLDHFHYFESMRAAMHLPAGSDMVLTETSSGENGYVHYKYQQYLSGIPVFGGRYILHEKDGRVMTASGRYSALTPATLRPGINAATAAGFARRAMGAKRYEERTFEPKLCLIDPTFPKVSESLLLVYQVDLYAADPYDRRRYFVDAATGRIIRQFPLLLREGVPSKAKTRYYGVQNIVTDSIAPQQFELRDPTRGGGIFIVNDLTGNGFTNTTSTWDLAGPAGDDVALDVHYCTQEYYDMMLADYSWQGLDGQGKALEAHVHGGDYANAFWNGEFTDYGDGDCNYNALTTLEVVGHEFTHGMIEYSSQLVYDGESGAINESLADMFGKMLERRTDPAHFSWDLGHSFIRGPEVPPFRRMDDPKSLQMPAFYQGEFWDEFSDVHRNSSIGNLWFSMVADGRQGVNEQGYTFHVPALGMSTAGRIVFEVNKNYFTSGSDYPAFRDYSVQVAETLYGVNSTEAQAVAEAWTAVGVTGGGSSPVFDLAVLYPQNAFNFCGLDAFMPVRFTVKNTGTIAYDPSMGATLVLSQAGLVDRVINLNTSIAPGELFEVQVNDWSQTPLPGLVTIVATLNLADENPVNNTQFSYVSVQEASVNDLSLYAGLFDPQCFAPEQHAEIYLNNNSCEAIPAGTVLGFSVSKPGGLLWSSPYTLAEDLPAFASIYIPVDIPTAYSTLTFKVIYASDPNPSNNEYVVSALDYLPITGTYFNDFQSNSAPDPYLDIEGAVQPLYYQGSNFFATTGEYEDPEDFTRCVDPVSVFNYEYGAGLNTTIRTCIDFSASFVPVLSFDLAQFRNTTAQANNDLYSSMFQAQWSGSASGKQTIYGQAEGAVDHYDIPLPAFFKGTLNLKFYTELGHFNTSPEYLDEDDFVLLDNLLISGPLSATREVAADKVVLSPNPAFETVRIRAEEPIGSLRLQNAGGQVLRVLPVHAAEYDLELKGLAEGFYLLEIQLENGRSAVRKLVKMH